MKSAGDKAPLMNKGKATIWIYFRVTREAATWKIRT